MRLWSLHPRYLDAHGLVACWRESLLAKAVLSGATRGYTHHPQLIRFRLQSRPLNAINHYLFALYLEASKRGYAFDRRKIGRRRTIRRIPVSTGQARYEFVHLKQKLWRRDRRRYYTLRDMEIPALHPLFRMVRGEIEEWERNIR